MKSDWLKMRALLTVALILTAFNLFSPDTARAQQRATNNGDGRGVRSEMLVSTDQLAGGLKDGQVIVLHVAREQAHYDKAHIPGARFVLWSELTATRDGVPNELPPVADLQKLFERLGIGDTKRIVLYGDSSGLSAARAYFTLDYLGHGHRAALLDGRLEKWQAERRTTSTEIPKFEAARFTPRVYAESVVSTDVTRDLSWTATNVPVPNVTLVDARPAEEYTSASSPLVLSFTTFISSSLTLSGIRGSLPGYSNEAARCLPASLSPACISPSRISPSSGTKLMPTCVVNAVASYSVQTPPSGLG